MARKLRFFKEQMSKAGISTSAQLTEISLDFDDLEVCQSNGFFLIACRI